MIDADLAALLESGCSTIVGLLTPSGEPYATRGWGTEVLDGDPLRIRVLVGAGAFAAVGLLPGDGATFAIAVTGANVRTLRSVQLKGSAHDLEAPTAADLERSRAYCEAFFGDVKAVDGIARAMMDRLVPADLLALTVDVTELYDQTPGPTAGSAISVS